MASNNCPSCGEFQTRNYCSNCGATIGHDKHSSNILKVFFESFVAYAIYWGIFFSPRKFASDMKGGKVTYPKVAWFLTFAALLESLIFFLVPNLAPFPSLTFPGATEIVDAGLAVAISLLVLPAHIALNSRRRKIPLGWFVLATLSELALVIPLVTAVQAVGWQINPAIVQGRTFLPVYALASALSAYTLVRIYASLYGRRFSSSLWRSLVGTASGAAMASVLFVVVLYTYGHVMRYVASYHQESQTYAEQAFASNAKPAP